MIKQEAYLYMSLITLSLIGVVVTVALVFKAGKLDYIYRGNSEISTQSAITENP